MWKGDTCYKLALQTKIHECHQRSSEITHLGSCGTDDSEKDWAQDLALRSTWWESGRGYHCQWGGQLRQLTWTVEGWRNEKLVLEVD